MDLKLEQDRLLVILYRYRYLYITSILALGIIGYLITKIADKEYQVQATVLVRSGQQMDRSLAPVELQQGFSISRTAEGFRNEILFLTSYNNIEAVLKRLDEKVTYYKKENFFKGKQELWENSPLIVELLEDHIQAVELNFQIKKEQNTLWLNAEGENVSLYNISTWQKFGVLEEYSLSREIELGDTITTPYFAFVVKLNNNIEVEWEYQYYFKINNFYKQVDYYKNGLTVNLLGSQITAAEVNLFTNIPNKGVLFMEYLLEEYLRQDLDKKNSLAQGTIDYIDYQIAMVEDSLNDAESQLKTYRSTQNLSDINVQKQQILQTISELERERANLNFSYQYYYMLNEQVKDEDVDNFVLPSQGDVEDQVLVQLVSTIMDKISERKSLIQNNSNNKSLFALQMENEIQGEINNISNHIKSKIARLRLQIETINSRLLTLRGELSQAPEKEIRLAKFERRFNLEDDLYSFLLRKRAEAEMAKKSNLPNKEIINPARLVSSDPVYPRKKVNYAIAILLGIIIPTTLVFYDFFYKKTLYLIDEVENNFPYFVFGRIAKYTVAKSKKGANPFEESLRYLKYNIDLKGRGNTNKVLGFTSSVSEEGKSFISWNFAKMVASFKHKVVYVNLDFRKSNQAKIYKQSKRGFYDVISGQVEISEVIEKREGVDYIEPGNGFQLAILGEDGEKVLRYIMEDLKSNYEYIIMDFPPLGIVADFLQIIGQIDFIMFMIRLGHSEIGMVDDTIKTLNMHIDKQKVALVINGVREKNRYYGKYYN